MNDRQLLRQYLDCGSEAAFGQIVDRHKKLVRWTCRQDLNDTQLAEDAAQMVFIALARRASSIRDDASLTAWLFAAARLASKNVRASEYRRQRNEKRAAMQRQTEEDISADWQRVQPWINDALSSLPERDRSAILQRYFGDYSFPEIATAMGTTEEAARKRVHRALDRLRLYMSKKEVGISAAVIGTLLLEQSANAAPISSTTLTGSAILSASSQTGVSPALLIQKVLWGVANAAMKKTIIGAAIFALFATGITMGVLMRHKAMANKALAKTNALQVVGRNYEKIGQSVGMDKSAPAGYLNMVLGGVFNGSQRLITLNITVASYDFNGKILTTKTQQDATVYSGGHTTHRIVKTTDHWKQQGGTWIMTDFTAALSHTP
ncbi:MAG: polymerase, sigma-24 subunit, subfamily [Capsulimonas sp.]|nr:polymerase, sigma-24 subunit, subfamily [Capsulimonas sp.]